MIDLTPIIQAAIALIAALITIYLIPWIKSKTTSDQQAQVRMWIEVAVYAAEKAYGAGHGDEKLAYAEQVLAGHNIKLDTQTLKAMIDAEIKRMEQADGVLISEEIEVADERDAVKPPDAARQIE